MCSCDSAFSEVRNILVLVSGGSDILQKNPKPELFIFYESTLPVVNLKPILGLCNTIKKHLLNGLCCLNWYFGIAFLI